MWQTIKNYFKEQSKTEKKKLKDMTLKEKIEYIWEYYRLHIIGTIIIIFIAGSIINGILNPPLPPFAGIALYEIYLGENFENEFEQTITEKLINDPALEKLYIHSFISGGDPSAEMALGQKLMAMLTTNELDLFIAETDVFKDFIYEDMLLPINEAGIFVPEELLVYGQTLENPEELAYGINLKDSELFRGFNVLGEKLAVGVIVNTVRLENTISVLKYILE